MVRHIWQWAYKPVALRVPSLESVRDVVPGSLVIPKAIDGKTESGVAAVAQETQPALGSILTEN
jgi:hypothetical protein